MTGNNGQSLRACPVASAQALGHQQQNCSTEKQADWVQACVSENSDP